MPDLRIVVELSSVLRVCGGCADASRHDLRDCAIAASTFRAIDAVERATTHHAAMVFEPRECSDHLVELVQFAPETRQHVRFPELRGEHAVFELARIELPIGLLERVVKMLNKEIAPP